MSVLGRVAGGVGVAGGWRMGRFSRPSLVSEGLDVGTQPEPAWRLPFHSPPPPRPPLPGARQPGPKSLSPSGPLERPARRNRSPPPLHARPILYLEGDRGRDLLERGHRPFHLQPGTWGAHSLSSAVSQAGREKPPGSEVGAWGSFAGPGDLRGASSPKGPKISRARALRAEAAADRGCLLTQQ